MARGASPLKEYRTLAPYFRRFKYRYALGFLFLLIVDASQVIIPQFMRRAVDTIAGGDFELREVIIPAASMVALMGIIAAGRFFWRYFIHGASRQIEAELREKLFGHLLSLSSDFYQKHKIGDLMARATNDLNAVRESIGMGFVALVDGTVMAAAILVIIFVQDASVAAWAVLPLPLITILILLFAKAIGRRFRRAHEAYSSLSDGVQETFAGIRVIQSFVKEWWFTKQFARANDNYRDANMGLVRLYGAFFPFVGFLSGLTVLIALLAGGIQVIEGRMSPGSLVAMFRYLQMLIWPLVGAGWVVNVLQRGAVSLGRINEILNTEPSIRDRPPSAASRQPPPASGFPEIEARDLSFSYDGDRMALENIRLSVEKGQWLGILGRTGSGKSTLIKAITRMVEPPAGTVFIQGKQAADWDVAALRGLFAVTPQDSYLFSDSIKNNIGYSQSEEEAALTGEAALQRAAAVAGLDRDMRAFASGWDTLIGERGLTLSGGQKQRAAIARALAAVMAGGREILILDDSLSAVDAETERAILDGLFELGREIGQSGPALTAIIVSHRVSALSRADHVIVLDKGRIVEQGSPARLQELGGFYARTAALQRLGVEDSGG
ncbi:MAG: ABC transporter ATP-binding protein/permease [Treponema sp.]|nr:ABC transporter ATP-binding protein/permease [Treponema sp.]